MENEQRVPKGKGSQAYPLDWPVVYPRTKLRFSSKFGEHTVKQCVDTVRAEALALGARYLVVSTNIPLRQDGSPYSNPGRMDDPGVAVYFHLKDKPYCMPCDKWNKVEHNLWAVAKNIEAMRGMQRWGVGSVEQQFAGFKVLEAGSVEPWWQVLAIRPDATREQIEAAWKACAKLAHPDAGGSTEAMARVNAARTAALTEKMG